MQWRSQKKFHRSFFSGIYAEQDDIKPWKKFLGP